MNAEQSKSLARALLVFLSGLLGGYGVHKNWFTQDQVEGFVTNETVVSFVGLLLGGAWGLYAHTKKNAVAVVDAMPEVKAVITAPTVAGDAVAKAQNSPTVAPVGSMDAVALAKGK